MKAVRVRPQESSPPRLGSPRTDGSPRAATRWEVEALRLRPRLVALARRIVRDAGEAADVVDDAILGLSEICQRGAEPRELHAWLYRTVTNRAIDRARRWVREQRGAGRVCDRREPDAPGAALERQELREAVWRSLLDLPRRQREVMVLRELEGLPYLAVAEILELEPSTARAHAHAARESLRRRLKEWSRDPH